MKDLAVDRAQIFWVDLRLEQTTDINRELFSKHFVIKYERRGLSQALKPHFMLQEERRISEDDTRFGQSRSRIDLCCFDFDYPDLSSLKLLKKTRELYPHLPILMLTEYHSEELAMWALRLHVWDLLVKPVNAAAVEEVALAVKMCKHNSNEVSHLLDCPNSNCLVPEALRVQPSPSAIDSIKPGLLFINDHLKEKISGKQVAEVCGLGPFTFSKTFKKLMGLTFQEYLQQQRISESIRLLRHPSASITDVAFLSGFKDISYFSKVFKRVTGYAPSDFRDNGGRASLKVELDEISRIGLSCQSR